MCMAKTTAYVYLTAFCWCFTELNRYRFPPSPAVQMSSIEQIDLQRDFDRFQEYRQTNLFFQKSQIKFFIIQ